MTVAIPPRVDTGPPPTDPIDGRRRAWNPNAIAEHVFPEPGRRELAVAAGPVEEFQDRIVNELRWLHGILENQRTRIVELETARSGAMATEATRMKGQARAEAAAIVANGHQKANQLMAEAMERIAAINAEQPDELTLVQALPPLDLDDVTGSMAARADYVTQLVRQVRADASMFDRASVATHRALDAINDPPVAGPTPLPPVNAGRGLDRYTDPKIPMEIVHNASNDVVNVSWGATSVPVRPGQSVTVRGDMITEDLRQRLAGTHPDHGPIEDEEETYAERALYMSGFDPEAVMNPDEQLVRVLEEHPDKGIRKGAVLPLSFVPSGVLYENTDPADWDREIAEGKHPGVTLATDDGAITEDPEPAADVMDAWLADPHDPEPVDHDAMDGVERDAYDAVAEQRDDPNA